MGRNGEDAGLSPSLPSVFNLVYDGLGFLVRTVVHDVPAVDPRLDAIRLLHSHARLDELFKPNVRLFLSEFKYFRELAHGHEPGVHLLSASVATNEGD